MNHLQPDELGELDREITTWGHQGFEDISSIVYEDIVSAGDKRYPPILDDEDIVRRKVKTMKAQGADLFITTHEGEILHYRMTVERL